MALRSGLARLAGLPVSVSDDDDFNLENDTDRFPLPAGGTNYGASIASTDNAQTFWSQGVCGMLDWGVNVFYFEAFDEPWKPLSTGDDGTSQDETHWGAYTSDRVAKFSLTC